MRIETNTRELYKFDELSDEAKGRARDWWRKASEGDSFWSECALDDYADNVLPLLGVAVGRERVNNPRATGRPQIYFSGFWSQGDGACFTGSYAYRLGAAKAIRQELPTATALHEVADKLQAVQARNFYRLTASIEHAHDAGSYSHEYTVRVSVERTDGADAPEDDAETVTECLRNVMRWIYRSLEAEWEYQNSDETVDDTIRANEYEFTADGRIS